MSWFSRKPEFLSDGAIYTRVREVIAGSKQRLTIVSPYVDPTGDFVRQMQAASTDRRVDVRLIFRRDKTQEYLKKEWLQALLDAKVRIGTVDRLHSKIYASEEEVIVASMNFYSSSGENSFESGISFEGGSDLAKDAKAYLEVLERHAEWITGTGAATAVTQKVAAMPAAVAASTPVTKARRSKPEGFCIRCAKGIALNPERPYCSADFAAWSQYSNADYRDKVCHACGSDHPATMRKPVCRSCYQHLVA